MTGVWYDKNRDKWRVRFRNRQIGRYNTEKEAIQIRVALEKTLPKATLFQYKCYLLCSPDFKGLTQRHAAQLLHTANSNVCIALRRLKKKCPDLFPIYIPRPKIQSYKPWMDAYVVEKI